MLMICAVEIAGMAIAASADKIQTTRRKRRMHVPLRRRDYPAARYSHDRMMRQCGAQSKKLRRESSSRAGNPTHVVALATAIDQTVWVLVVLTAQRGLPIFAEKQTISKARRRVSRGAIADIASLIRLRRRRGRVARFRPVLPSAATEAQSVLASTIRQCYKR